MAKRISELNPVGALQPTDLVAVVINPSTAPESRKATVSELRGAAVVSLYDEATLLGNYSTLKFAGDSVTVTEESPGVALVTLSSGGATGGSHVVPLTLNGLVGDPGDYVVLLRYPCPVAVTIPADFAGSRAVVEQAATNDTFFYMYKNGVWIGDVKFAAGSQVGVFRTEPTGSVHSFAAGDVLKLETDYGQDATLADIGIVLKLNV